MLETEFDMVLARAGIAEHVFAHRRFSASSRCSFWLGAISAPSTCVRCTLTASILLWSEYERCDHPCWQMNQRQDAFNEESGEFSPSVLARDIARGGVRSDCKNVSQTFRLVKAKAQVAADYRSGHCGR